MVTWPGSYKLWSPARPDQRNDRAWLKVNNWRRWSLYTMTSRQELSLTQWCFQYWPLAPSTSFDCWRFEFDFSACAKCVHSREAWRCRRLFENNACDLIKKLWHNKKSIYETSVTLLQTLQECWSMTLQSLCRRLNANCIGHCNKGMYVWQEKSYDKQTNSRFSGRKERYQRHHGEKDYENNTWDLIEAIRKTKQVLCMRHYGNSKLWPNKAILLYVSAWYYFRRTR